MTSARSVMVMGIVSALIATQNALADESSNSAKGLEAPIFEAYTVNKATTVRAVLNGQLVQLPVGTDITVLGSKVDPTYGDLVHIGLDDDSEDTPSELWIRATDLADAALEASGFLTDRDDPTLDELDNGVIYGDDDVAAAKRLLRRKRRMTYCYRFVKQHLLQTGKTKSYLPGGSAWMAMKYLPQAGFRMTGHTPKTARIGEVCVYKGGPQGHGHIEVKRPQGWWYGYGYHGPIQNRKFVGCYTK